MKSNYNPAPRFVKRNGKAYILNSIHLKLRHKMWQEKRDHDHTYRLMQSFNDQSVGCCEINSELKSSFYQLAEENRQLKEDSNHYFIEGEKLSEENKSLKERNETLNKYLVASESRRHTLRACLEVGYARKTDYQKWQRRYGIVILILSASLIYALTH